MSLKDDLLPLIDPLRAIASDLGFRPYQVWVRTTVYNGPQRGSGTKTVTDTRLLVGGKDPKVRIVRSRDVAAGTNELQFAEFEIGPLTPQFPRGGVPTSLINPDKDTNPSSVSFLLKGPGLPPEGLLCQRTADRVDNPLRVMIRVKSSGRKPAT